MDRLRILTKGRRVTLEMAETLPGPADLVWRLITDWEHQDDWMLEASDFVLTSEAREGIGVEAEATISIGGIRTRDRVRVTGWEPNRRLAMAHLGWVKGEGEIFLTPLGGSRTYLFWRETLSPPLGSLGALGMALLKPLMVRVFRRDLRILRSLTRAAAQA